MNEEEKQAEIKKIIDVCEENSIKYDPSKLNFIEKDTREEVENSYYEIIVIKENNQLKLDDFYSVLTTLDYTEKFSASKNLEYLEIKGKKIIGYIVINNTLNENRFYYFSNNHCNYTNSKKIKLDDHKTHTIKNQFLNLDPSQKSHIKYDLYYYLRDNKYLENRVINDKLVMCLNTKDEKLENISIYINKKLGLSTNELILLQFLKMCGFKWNNKKYHKLPILVDIKTFETYYLPLVSIKSIPLKELVFKLRFLHECYLNPLTPTRKEEIMIVLDLSKNMYDFFSFDKKHTAYPKL